MIKFDFTRNRMQNQRIKFQNHHITNSDSQSTSGPVFVVIIYSDPIYFQTDLQGRSTSFLGNSMPASLADVALIIHQELHFMRDGTPAHFGLVAPRYLNRKFLGYWIVRCGPIAWPPCSPDLN
jgi:hypothetical protein